MTVLLPGLPICGGGWGGATCWGGGFMGPGGPPRFSSWRRNMLTSSSYLAELGLEW